MTPWAAVQMEHASRAVRRAIHLRTATTRHIGAFLSNLYQCLCCPDPCYQPRWEPAANASFFADYARPRTITRIRYDNLNDHANARPRPILHPECESYRQGIPRALLPRPDSSRSRSTRKSRDRGEASSSVFHTTRSTRTGPRPQPASATSTSA